MAYADPQSPQAIACWKRSNARNAWKIRAKRYNVSEEYLLEIWERQKHCCAICERGPLKLPHVDHDHKTKQVRGILCASCNRMLGLAQDCPERLGSAADYLRRARLLSCDSE